MKRFLAVLALAAGCAAPESDPVSDAERYRPAPPSRPAEPESGSLTLDGALSLAERRHPDLAAARARIEAAEGRALQAGLPPNPALVGKLESAPFEGRTVADAELLAGLSQRLPAGGRLGAAREAERLDAERIRRELELRILDLRARVRGAFATALFAAEAADLQAGTLDVARRAASLIRARLEAGDATPDELARADIDEARTGLEIDKARSLRDLAFVALAAALGDPSLRIHRLEGRPEESLELPSIEAVLAGLEDGPHAALARADVEAAQGRVDLAAVERIPDVTLDLFYRRLGASDENAFDVGVAVPLPVFDRNQGRIREAEAERRVAQARAQASRGEAVRRIREAHAKLSEALKHVRRLRDEILPRLATVVRISEARHAAGDLALAGLLPIRREGAAGRLAHLEALREVMEAWAELRPFLRP